VFDERRASIGAVSGDDVDDACGDASVRQGLHEVVGGERGVFGGLDDAGITGDKSREELPRGNGHGEVPGGDHADYAEGHANGHCEFVGEFGGRGLTEEAASFACDVVGFVDCFLDVATGFGEDFAHFAGHLTGELFFALGEELSGAEEDFGAFWSGDEAPGGEGLLCGCDGFCDVFGIGGRKFADDVGVVGGVDVQDDFTAAGWQPFAAD